jgi:FMN phosphatase YigB (HAD superfamily)
MKLLLDFDDVLFDTSRLKETFFAVLNRHGVLRAKEKYHFERANDRPFSLKLFIRRLCKEKGIGNQEADAMYDEVMSVCGNLVNQDLVRILERVGSKNCYLITNGDEGFQKDKIICSGIKRFIEDVVIVPGTKKFAIESLCAKFPDEPVIFVDDREKFFEDIDTATHKNLKTVLYDGTGVGKLEQAIEESR